MTPWKCKAARYAGTAKIGRASAAMRACRTSGGTNRIPLLRRYPLNLGGCFAYALATVEDLPILALDGDFRSTDRPVVHPDEP